MWSCLRAASTSSSPVVLTASLLFILECAAALSPKIHPPTLSLFSFAGAAYYANLWQAAFGINGQCAPRMASVPSAWPVCPPHGQCALCMASVPHMARVPLFLQASAPISVKASVPPAWPVCPLHGQCAPRMASVPSAWPVCPTWPECFYFYRPARLFRSEYLHYFQLKLQVSHSSQATRAVGQRPRTAAFGAWGGSCADDQPMTRCVPLSPRGQ